MKHLFGRVSPAFKVLVLSLLLGLVATPQVFPASISELETELDTTNKKLRAINREIAAMESFLGTYSTRTNVIVENLEQLKRFEQFASKTLRNNLLKATLSAGLATMQQTMDGFGGLSKTIGQFAFETLLNLSIDEAVSSWSAPYKVKVQSFKAESVELIPSLRRINRLLQMEDFRVRALALAKEGVELGPKGLAIWKVRTLRDEARASIASVTTYLDKLRETKDATEAELSQLTPRRDALAATRLQLQSQIAAERQALAAANGAAVRETVETTLGQEQADPPPTVSPQEQEETPLQQYRKYYDAAAAKLQGEWPTLLVNLHTRRTAFLEEHTFLVTNTLPKIPGLSVPLEPLTASQLPPSLRELIIEHQVASGSLEYYRDSGFLTLIAQAQAVIDDLQIELSGIAELEHRKAELELYARSINAIYTSIVGGEIGSSDDVLHYLNTLPKPDGFQEEFNTLRFIQGLGSENERLNATKTLLTDAITVLADTTDSLATAFSTLFAERMQKFTELQQAITRFQTAFATCVEAAESWDAYLLAHDYGSSYNGNDYVWVDKPSGEGVAIPAAEFGRYQMMRDLAEPYRINTTYDVLHQNYTRLLDTYILNNLTFTTARMELLDAWSTIETSGSGDYPRNNSSFGSFDGDWLDASTQENTPLRAPLPDLTHFNEVNPMLDGAVGFKTFRSLRYPGSPDDPDRVRILRGFQQTLDQIDSGNLVSVSVINLTLDRLYALWREFDEDDKSVFQTWIGAVRFYAQDQQFSHRFADPPALGPTITRQPTGVTLLPGTEARLVVQGAGDGVLLYHWARTDPDFPGDPNQAIGVGHGFRPYLHVSADDPPGEYFVTVSNGTGDTRSDMVSVTVNGGASLTLATNETHAPAGANQQALPVTTSTPDLNWLAQSSVSWIQIGDEAASGRGNGSVTFQLEPNDSGGPREGEIRIGNQVHTVMQDYTPTDFNTWSQTYPGAPADDVSGDGLNSFVNFAMGTDPTRNNLDKRPTLRLTRNQRGDSVVELRYRRSKLATALQFKLRQADTLGQWVDISPSQAPESDDGDSWIYVVEIPAEPTAPQTYFNILAVEP